jgi:hypothetical protein
MGLQKDPVQYYFFTIAEWYEVNFETVSVRVSWYVRLYRIVLVCSLYLTIRITYMAHKLPPSYVTTVVMSHFIILVLEFATRGCWQRRNGVTAGIFWSPLMWALLVLHFNGVVPCLSEVFGRIWLFPNQKLTHTMYRSMCGQKWPGDTETKRVKWKKDTSND